MMDTYGNVLAFHSSVGHCTQIRIMNCNFNEFVLAISKRLVIFNHSFLRHNSTGTQYSRPLVYYAGWDQCSYPE